MAALLWSIIFLLNSKAGFVVVIIVVTGQTKEILLVPENHTQFPGNIDVCAGFLGDNIIIVPLFIDGNLTGGIYLDLLQDAIGDLIFGKTKEPRGQPLNK